jgi:hypothetical protein
MANWDEVGKLALELPETGERLSRDGARQWRVREKLFVWERPLRRRELETYPGKPPEGEILAARVEHLGAKEALLADEPRVHFTTSHFDGYPAILVRLERVTADDLRELIVEAWLARAPKRLAKELIERCSDSSRSR